MKNSIRPLVLVLCAVISFLPIRAQQISEPEALSRAQAFMNNRYSSEAPGVRRAPRKAPRFKTALKRNEFYIFNDEANNGFVIVSGEERTPDILGYSDDGHIDSENMPEALKELLEQYSLEIKAIKAGAPVADGAPEFTPIAPLIATAWGQGSPYNLLCPLEGTSRCLTGCVPTAMAQLLYYWQWPKSLSTDVPAHRNDLSVIPAGTNFQWDSMLERYNADATEAQQQAVALLMVACGQACKASYGTSGTSAYYSNMLDGLHKYFDFSENSFFASRNDYKSSDWETLIYGELQESRPVGYRGTHIDDGGGHMFICDGYATDHYFHFNFGWNGNSNGYYLLALAKSGAGTSYAIDQCALVCLQPNNLPAVEPAVGPTRVSGSYTDLIINSYTLPEQLKRDQRTTIVFNISNQGEDFFGPFYISHPCVGQVNEMNDIDANSTRDMSFSFIPYRSGKGRFMLSTDSEGLQEIGQTPETVLDLGTEDDCYLYNPASGLYLCAGNKWGTHASLGEAGMNVALIGTKDVYSIETLVCSGGVKHYLGSDFYVDQEAVEWRFEFADDGTFSMTTDGNRYLAYDGYSRDLTTVTDPTDYNARWQKRSREEVIAIMKGATSSKPIDVTCLISGADFGRYDLRTQQWIGGARSMGRDANFHVEKFDKAFDTYQVITGLPNGTYQVRVQAFYSGDGQLYPQFYANDASTAVKSIYSEKGNCPEGIMINGDLIPYSANAVSTCFSEGLYWNELTTEVTDGTLRLGIRKSEEVDDDWTCFDNFHLIYYGDGTSPNLASCEINVTANPAAGGSVTGYGTFQEGQNVVLKATPAEGYRFDSWMEDGKVVSTSLVYSFIATRDRTLKAHFLDEYEGFSNEKLYTLTCRRGSMVLNETGTRLATDKTRTDAIEDEGKFAIITIDGKHYLYSPVIKQFLAADGFFVNRLGSPIELDDSHADEDYKYMLITRDDVGQPYYFNFDGSGNIVINDYQKPDDGNRWKIEEVEDFDPAEALALANSTCTVTYNIEFGNKIIATTSINAEAGGSLPALPTSLMNPFILLSPTSIFPEIVKNDVTLTYRAEWNGPFQFTTSMRNAKWYNMHIRSGYYVGKQDNEPYYPAKVNEETLATPEYQWAFGGDPYHVKVYNRSTDLDEVLTRDGNNAVMREGDYSWEILANSDGFILRTPGTTNSCINQNGGTSGPLQFWTDNRSLKDDGSTFRVIEVEEPEPTILSYEFDMNNGMFYRSSKNGDVSFTPKDEVQYGYKWTANDTEALQLMIATGSGANNMIVDTEYGWRVHTDTYDLTLPLGYLITGYELTAYTNYTGGSTINGTTISTDIEHPTTISVTDLESREASFTVATGDPWIVVTGLTVNYRMDKPVHTVTYEVMYNNKIVATDAVEVLQGDPIPDVPSSLDNGTVDLFISGTYPKTVTTDLTIIYTCASKFFKLTTSLNDATWYNMHIRSGYYVGKQSSEPYYPAQVNEETLETLEYQWAFGGDPYHIKVYNRSTGLDEVLTREGNNAVMREGDYAWDILANNDGFVLRTPGTTNSCINQNGGTSGPLQFWTNDKSLTDDGSTMRVEEVMTQIVEGDYVLIPNGTYYLYNTAAQLYLAPGGSSGTRAALNVAGTDCILTQQDGGSLINTRFSDGDGLEYLGYPVPSMTQAATTWLFLRQDDGTYALTPNKKSFLTWDGETSQLTMSLNPEVEAAHWQLLTRDDIIAQMATATMEMPVDVSSLISYPNFDKGGNERCAVWEGAAAASGLDDNFFSQKFDQESFDIHQDITGLPNGIYKVCVQAFYREGCDKNWQPTPAVELYLAGEEHFYAKFYANEAVTSVVSIFEERDMCDVGVSTAVGMIPNSTKDVSKWFANDLYWNELETEVKDGTLRIGLRKDTYVFYDWLCFDSFRLLYYGPKPIIDAIAVSKADANIPSAIFNLSGQRMSKMQRGVNIVNGKKVVMRQ